MTQILICLAKDFIVLASDRRLTRRVDGKVKVDDDNSNKALIYSNHFAFAYTGLAKLDDQYPSAIDWAAQQLSEKENLGDAVLHLGNQASDLINSNYIRNLCSHSPASIKRLAFVGAGFADIEEDGKRNRKPLRIVISNFFRKDDGAWTAVPYSNFRVHFHWLPEDRSFELFVGGQPLDKDREAQLNRILERCMRNKVKPEMIGRLLTREIQKAAALYKTVGKNIMCVMVPRPSGDSTNTWTYRFGAVELKRPVISAEPQRLGPVEVVRDQYRFAIPPPLDTPVFVYVAGDSKALPYYGPVLVGSQCVVPPVIMHEMNIIVPPVSPAHGPQVDTTPY